MFEKKLKGKELFSCLREWGPSRVGQLENKRYDCKVLISKSVLERNSRLRNSVLGIVML